MTNELGDVLVCKGQSYIWKMHHVTNAQASNCCKIGDKDFRAKFNGKKRTVELDGRAPRIKKTR